MKQSRGVLLGVVVAAVALLGALWLGAPDNPEPLDPRSHEPGGTSALVALLRELGATVELDAGADGSAGLDSDVDVALVLRDRFDGDQRADLTRWVRQGGTLVVVDPSSPFTPSVPGGDDAAAVLGSATLGVVVEVGTGRCDIAPLDDEDITVVEVYGGPVDYEVRGPAQSCFGNRETAYVVASPEGEGAIVAVGGSGIIVNRTLDEGDNAPVAAALLAPTEGTRVAVFDPSVPAGDEVGSGEGDETLWGLVPAGVKRGMAQLGVAFLIYVVWRARRLGKPVDEPQPVKVAGSELVAAVGGLLERSKSPQHAAEVLRADLRRDLTAHLGLAPNAPVATLAEVVAARSRLDGARLQAALGPGPVDSDRDLLAVAQLIDIVREEVFDHVGS